jgi:hypothetical protein
MRARLNSTRWLPLLLVLNIALWTARLPAQYVPCDGDCEEAVVPTRIQDCCCIQVDASGKNCVLYEKCGCSQNPIDSCGGKC